MTALHFDCNATTAASDQVVAAMVPWLGAPGANPSATHPAGRKAGKAVRAARESVAALVGAPTAESIVFTSCGSESTMTAVRTALTTQVAPNESLAVVSAAEHSATKLSVAHFIGDEHIVRVPVDSEGALDRDALFAAIERRPALVSLILLNNETGVISNLADVGAACREHGTLFHLDAVQAPAKTPIDAIALDCDFLSLSAHKFHGPRGIGALYVRRGVDVRPLIVGGPQEGERRAGTENVPSIVGMGVAADLARERALQPASQAECAERRDRLENAILAGCPGARVHGSKRSRATNTSNIGFDLRATGLDATALLALLHDQGIEVSAGSACNSKKSAPSPVLLAMGLDETDAASALRFSLAHAGTPDWASMDDVDTCAAAVIEAVHTIAALAN